MGPHSLVWRPLDELLSLKGLLVGLLVHQERRVLQQERHAIVAQRALPLRPTSLFLPGFRLFRFFLLFHH